MMVDTRADLWMNGKEVTGQRKFTALGETGK